MTTEPKRTAAVTTAASEYVWQPDPLRVRALMAVADAKTQKKLGKDLFNAVFKFDQALAQIKVEERNAAVEKRVVEALKWGARWDTYTTTFVSAACPSTHLEWVYNLRASFINVIIIFRISRKIQQTSNSYL